MSEDTTSSTSVTRWMRWTSNPPVMYDGSVWTHAGNGWETEPNKIFLLAEKDTKSFIGGSQK